MPEIISARDLPTQAQPLLVGSTDETVFGTVQPDGPGDLYRILAGPIVSAVCLDLAVAPDSGAGRLWIAEGSGHVLVDQPLAASTTITIWLIPGAGLDSDSPLDAAIVRVPATGEDVPEVFSYHLRAVRVEGRGVPDTSVRVAHLSGLPSGCSSGGRDPIGPSNVPVVLPPAPSGSTTGPDAGGAPSGPGVPSPVQVETPSGDPGNGPTSPPLPTGNPGASEPPSPRGPVQSVPPPSPGGGSVPLVPLPTSRSAQVGGVFGFEGSTPVVIIADGTRVDRALIDAPPRGWPAPQVMREGRAPVPMTRADGNRVGRPHRMVVRPSWEIALEVVEGFRPSRDASFPMASREPLDPPIRVADVPDLSLAADLVALGPEDSFELPGPGPIPPPHLAWAVPADGEPAGGERPRRELPRAAVRIAAHGSAALAFGLLWGPDLAVARHRLAVIRPRRRPVR